MNAFDIFRFLSFQFSMTKPNTPDILPRTVKLKWLHVFDFIDDFSHMQVSLFYEVAFSIQCSVFSAQYSLSFIWAIEANAIGQRANRLEIDKYNANTNT